MNDIPTWKKNGVVPIWERGRKQSIQSSSLENEGKPLIPLESTPAVAYLQERNIPLYSLESYILKLYVPNPKWAETISLTELRKLNTFGVEAYMCKQYASHGWIVIQTIGSGDAGLDAMAIKGTRRLGIQIKALKEEGKVSSTDVMVTTGGGSYWRCNELHFITTGNFTKFAREVASKSQIITRLSNHIQMEENNIWS